MVENSAQRLIARLNDALAASGRKKVDLARACGVTPQAVNGWFVSGKISRDHLPAIAATLNTTVDALLSDAPETAVLFRRREDAPPSAKEPSADYLVHRVPVVGTAQLGDDGYWDELGFPTGHGDGFVNYPTRDKNAYALRVKGDSMRPRIKPGEFVVIEPNHPVAPGDEVLVTTTDGRSMVKVLQSRRNGMVELLSINEDHRPITLDESQIEKIHAVSAILKASLYYSDFS